MTTNATTTPATKGRLIRSWARFYDLLTWVLTRGRERSFRARLVELARIQPGEAVLDVGCGTGTLAIVAKSRVGTEGTVHGIDASPEMIVQARRKATRLGANVAFDTGVVEALPFPDGRFDVVLSTLMLHHLPRPARADCALEMRRVLRPAGRVLAVDFGEPDGRRHGILEHFHRHGHLALRDMVELLGDSGFRIVERGPVGFSNLQFVLAEAQDRG